MRNTFKLYYDQKFYNNIIIKISCTSLCFLAISFANLFRIFSASQSNIKKKSCFVSCIKNFNLNHVSEVVCNRIYSMYSEMNIL